MEDPTSRRSLVAGGATASLWPSPCLPRDAPGGGSAIDTLRTVTRTQGANLALKDGTVTPQRVRFEFEEVPVLVNAFRRMVRGLEFDICEMAFTTYLCARAHGVRFTAIPVFLVRAFHHNAIVCNVDAGIGSPKDLEGRRVGVNRGYTVTTGVWARAILQDEFGVDLDSITWLRSGDEHVTDYRPPVNVGQIEAGTTLDDLVSSGDLPAAVGLQIEHPNVRTLIPDPSESGFRSLRDRGLYPINHLVVIRDEVLAKDPSIARVVFEAFAEAKALYVQRLQDGGIETPSPEDEFYRRVMRVIGDPLPYGVEPNRAMIEELIRHVVSQQILPGSVRPEEVFASATLGLEA